MCGSGGAAAWGVFERPHLYSFLTATGLPERHRVVRHGKVDKGSRS